MSILRTPYCAWRGDLGPADVDGAFGGEVTAPRRCSSPPNAATEAGAAGSAPFEIERVVLPDAPGILDLHHATPRLLRDPASRALSVDAAEAKSAMVAAADRSTHPGPGRLPERCAGPNAGISTWATPSTLTDGALPVRSARSVMLARRLCTERPYRDETAVSRASERAVSSLPPETNIRKSRRAFPESRAAALSFLHRTAAGCSGRPLYSELVRRRASLPPVGPP
jgi:hypothetical protein